MAVKLFFNPRTGEQFEETILSTSFRENRPLSEVYAWLFNPFNGARRSLVDIQADPFGFIMTDDPTPHGYTLPTPTPKESVNHPRHYNAHPSGIECITIVEHMGFNVGNAIKYLWRADEKGNALEDLKKAAWYVQREIEKREKNIPAA